MKNSCITLLIILTLLLVPIAVFADELATPDSATPDLLQGASANTSNISDLIFDLSDGGSVITGGENGGNQNSSDVTNLATGTGDGTSGGSDTGTGTGDGTSGGSDTGTGDGTSGGSDTGTGTGDGTSGGSDTGTGTGDGTPSGSVTGTGDGTSDESGSGTGTGEQGSSSGGSDSGNLTDGQGGIGTDQQGNSDLSLDNSSKFITMNVKDLMLEPMLLSTPVVATTTNYGVISGKINDIETGDYVLVTLKKSSIIDVKLVNKDNPQFKFEGLSAGEYTLVFEFHEGSGVSTVEIGQSVPNKANAIIGTAIGGKKKITATVTSASNLDIKVTVEGPTPTTVKTIPNGVGSLTFDSLAKGTYKVTFKYTDPLMSDVPAYVIGDVVVTDESSKITISSVEAGTEQITVSGTADAGTSVLVSIDSSVSELLTVGTDGKFAKAISCPAGTYNTVVVQYNGDAESKETKTGPWTVKASDDKPALEVDAITETDLTVTAKTKAATTVMIDTNDAKQIAVADASGILRFSLAHSYAAGTKFTFTVYYGTDLKSSYNVTATVISASSYKTLSYGSTGEEVKALTTRLAALKYPVTATTMYDNTVVSAVQQFQTRNGLPITGIADAATQIKAYSSTAVAYDSYVYTVLVRGDRGYAVTLLQQRLKELGYYTIKVDGIFGSGTQRAVRNFQIRNGLTATGVADSVTQQVLYSSAAISAYGGGYTPSTYTTLSRSNKYNANVVPLQSRLNQLGYNAGTVDGYFGSKTYRAVANFQKKNGLSATGVADVYTQQVLYSSSALPASSYTTPVITPTTGFVLLSWGSKGDAVKRLQQALLNAGYSQVRSVDGIYGQWTYDAVRAFQKANGLTVDGIAGKSTQNLLYGTSY